MNAHVDPIAPDEVEIRRFFEAYHDAAATAFEGIADPGVLQLVRLWPDDRSPTQVVGRFPIGAVDAMTRAAVADASAGHNVYVEGRTVRSDLRGTKRGDLSDTRGVFALVIDADADKGRDAVLPVEAEPSICVESSPGNRHHWFALTRAVPAGEAQALGAAIRAASGADDDSGNVTQPYRVAGTPNFPGPKKQERGRIASSTGLLTEGRAYSLDELRALFPATPAAPQTAIGSPRGVTTYDRPARTSDALVASLSAKRAADLAAMGVEDRSAHFLRVTGWLKGEGYSLEEATVLWEAFPAGAGVEKYGARLAREVERVWSKAGDDPQVEADRVAEGAAITERLLAKMAKTVDVSTPPPSDPINLWGTFNPPPIPSGVLPAVIEEFARVRGEQMGADPAGLAMAAITTCAALISDRIQLRMKRHDTWTESARLWCALIGPPSTMKTPIIRAAVGPLVTLDNEMARANREAMAEFEELKQAGEKPRRPRTPRLRIEDVTIEKTQEIMADSPDGLLLLQDELSGWFGSMERYTGAKGGQKDRAFWLETYNGGELSVSRIGRGDLFIENRSICLLGGIQPDLVRKIAADTYDDGMFQRMLPIVLRPAEDDRDEAMPNVASQYGWLARSLHAMRPPFVGGSGNLSGSLETNLVFDDEAQELFRAVRSRHRQQSELETANRKLGSAIGKYNGLFGRLAIVFHCIEHADQERPPRVVTIDTARRVDTFMQRFLLPHAFTFYADIIGLADDQEIIVEVAGFLLAHSEVEEATFRTFARGSSLMRRCKERKLAEAILERLDALGWLNEKPVERNQTSRRWAVVPRIHELFADRARQEVDRRASVRARISAAINGEAF